MRKINVLGWSFLCLFLLSCGGGGSTGGQKGGDGGNVDDEARNQYVNGFGSKQLNIDTAELGEACNEPDKVTCNSDRSLVLQCQENSSGSYEWRHFRPSYRPGYAGSFGEGLDGDYSTCDNGRICLVNIKDYSFGECASKQDLCDKEGDTCEFSSAIIDPTKSVEECSDEGDVWSDSNPFPDVNTCNVTYFLPVRDDGSTYCWKRKTWYPVCERSPYYDVLMWKGGFWRGW